ncbi:MAG: YbaK/EbsC family protein [Syntrophomonadaceae bacterium]|nr:YbaK/EbsC family protein [Syntrophomonadaceae bacterium]MDD4550511.1 YbaK/EbsC family protein [Syntrophomonadaceae bacterium]
MHLHKGKVTPLGIINDSDAVVEVVLDNDLAGKNQFGFHPNDNTATVWIFLYRQHSE